MPLSRRSAISAGDMRFVVAGLPLTEAAEEAVPLGVEDGTDRPEFWRMVALWTEECLAPAWPRAHLAARTRERTLLRRLRPWTPVLESDVHPQRLPKPAPSVVSGFSEPTCPSRSVSVLYSMLIGPHG
jgi:hypothetical protein